MAEVAEALIELLVDEDLRLHAVGALGKLGATASRSQVENLLRDERPAVRRAAATVLRKFDRLESDAAK
ncbi:MULTISPECIES: HEAT repeat domain-containing protein [Kribbella]|uniref:HEAT repeat domain-containing protein n=1 Tax=Kribbella TaxID=182639 RepID=UPI0010629D94|nr:MULTISPECIES: HEAT repeat domain-containing protein [Kribbella]